MAVEETPAFRRLIIDSIYGHPKPFGFWAFFGACGIICLILVGVVMGHLDRGTIGTQTPKGLGDAPVPGDSALKGATLIDWMIPNPIFGSKLVAGVLALAILLGFAFYLYRQHENRRYYRRMYGSFYDRP